MFRNTFISYLIAAVLIIFSIPADSHIAYSSQESEKFENLKNTEKTDVVDVESDFDYRSGENPLIFTKGVNKVNDAKKRLIEFLGRSGSRSTDWVDVFSNINAKKGLLHMTLTIFIAVSIILCGIVMETVALKIFRELQQQIKNSDPDHWNQFLKHVSLNFILNLLGLGVYIITTFIVCALCYKEKDAGYLILTAIIVPSYYIRAFVLFAGLILSPSAQRLRLLPLMNRDAKFLHNWILILTITAIVIADIAYVLMYAGIGKDHFLMIYGMSGVSMTLLLIIMIWYGREEVARTIGSKKPDENNNITIFRRKISAAWHYFAIFYVVIIGGIWFVRALDGQGAMLGLVASLFLIPLFICLNHWAGRLLEIAFGLTPLIPQKTDSITISESSGPATTESQEKSRSITQNKYLPTMKLILRVFITIIMFFLILRLWGIDFFVGQFFTSTVLKITITLLLGIIVWQYAKFNIDKKLKQEMPDDDEEMEEGGKGGSRIGTLLILLRKFVFSVLFVLTSLIVLSSLGIEIAPLIAGAGIIGIAIGFGSQALVKDILSGVFFLIDDAFRVGDYIQSADVKGMVEKISLRSVKLRHPRGMVYTVPFGDMGSVENFSRDFIITKLDIRVRYDADIDKIRKLVKKINKEMQLNEEFGLVLLSKIKSQGVREMDDSGMILRVKFKTIPGEQFVIRREVYRLIQESFRENGIEFAYRNVTVYLPDEDDEAAGTDSRKQERDKLVRAGAAAAMASSQSRGMDSKNHNK